ncbi:MAG: hypothetical protein GY730_07035 [bacterium]|nr:hypothetical protein [bacterium]
MKFLLSILAGIILLSSQVFSYNLSTPAEKFGIGAGYAMGKNAFKTWTISPVYGINKNIEIGLNISEGSKVEPELNNTQFTSNQTAAYINYSQYLGIIGVTAGYSHFLSATTKSTFQTKEYEGNSKQLTIYADTGTKVTLYASKTWITAERSGHIEESELTTYGIVISPQKNLDIFINTSSDSKFYTVFLGYYI